jgi:hypothetical protein
MFNRLNKKIIASALAGIVLLSVGGIALQNNGAKAQEIINSLIPKLPGTDNSSTPNDEVKETITCFDFIDQLLMADGFKYLSGTRWGRGEKNFFLIDVASQEFQIADVYNTNVLTDTWFETELSRYVEFIYRHETGEATMEYFLRGVPNATDYDRNLYVDTREELADPNNNFYELPLWMNRYVAETERFGCPIIGITEEKLLGEYKTEMSKAEAKDVVSSFDLKSTDGVIKYFKDAFKEGRVQDDPRYKEITSLEEFAKLDSTPRLGSFYMTNIIYKNPANFTFESNRDGLHGKALEHFVKDVVFPNTIDPDNNPGIQPTVGVFFLYVDSPDFEYIYTAPAKNDLFSNVRSGQDMRKFIMPYDATAVYSNKGMNDPYKIYPYGVGFVNNILSHYMRFITELNPSVQFSDDFVRNYTRPFDIKWQKQMGLSDFLDAKFGLIDRSVKYLH